MRVLSGLALVALVGSIIVLSGACNTKPPAPATLPATPESPTSTPPQAVSSTAVAEPSPVPTPELPLPLRTLPDTPKWRLAFNDEFDGSSLNTDNWSTQLQWGRINRPELQYYSPDAFELKDGILRIKADRQTLGGMDYSSGIISTYWHFWFTFGYVEMRAKLPSGAGLWPAFWLLDKYQQSPDEIDVMEVRGQNPQTLVTTLHYGPNPETDVEDKDHHGPDLSQEFHIFAVKWDPSAVIWYLDGTEIFRVTDHVPQKPMYVMANLAVGGNFAGSPTSSTAFPAYMDIDYIRVWVNN